MDKVIEFEANGRFDDDSGIFLFKYFDRLLPANTEVDKRYLVKLVPIEPEPSGLKWYDEKNRQWRGLESEEDRKDYGVAYLHKLLDAIVADPDGFEANFTQSLTAGTVLTVKTKDGPVQQRVRDLIVTNDGTGG
jgi:hypothetical protein